MSEPTPDTKQVPTKHEPRRRWRRRLLIAAAIVVLLRLSLVVFLLPIADFALGTAGLSLSWRAASLSLLGASFHAEDVVVRLADDPDAPPLFVAHDLIADLSSRMLLGGRIGIVDVAIAGARVTIERRSDGTLRLPAAWLAPAADPAPVPATTTTNAPTSLQLPVQIEALRVHGLEVVFVDHVPSPAATTRLTVDLDASSIGFGDRSGSVRLRAHTPQFADAFWLDADVRTSDDAAEATCRWSVRGVPTDVLPLDRDLLALFEGAQRLDADAEIRWSGARVAGQPPDAPPVHRAELQFTADLDRRRVIDLSAESGPTRRERDATALPFVFTFDGEGLGRVRVTDAEVELGRERTTFAARLEAEQLVLRRAHGLLEAAGITLPAEGVAVRCSLDGETGAGTSLRLRDLTTGDGSVQLTSLTIDDVRTNGDTLAVGGISLVGSEVHVRRLADGAIVVAGLTLRASTTATPRAADAAPPEPSSPFVLPKLRLGSLSTSGITLRFTDEATSPPLALVLEDVRMRADGLVVGADAPPGRISIAARTRDLLGAVRFEALVRPTPDRLTIDAEAGADGITCRALVPVLEPIGITPTFTDGKASLGLQLTLAAVDGAATLDVQLDELQLRDGERTLASVAGLRGAGCRFGGATEDLGDWTLRAPFVAVDVAADGAIHALGFRIAPAPTSTTAVATGTPAVASTTTATMPPPTTAHRGAAHVVDGAIALRRLTAAPDAEPRTWTLGYAADLAADDGRGTPASFALALRMDGAADELALRGTLAVTPGTTALEGTITGRGLRAGAWQELLPPHVRCTLTDGALDGAFAATFGAGLEASLRDLRLRDGDDEPFGVALVRVAAPQLTADDVHVEALEVLGVRTRLELRPDGVALPGFVLGPTATAEAPPAAATNESQTNESRTSEHPANAAPFVLPALRLDRVQIELAQLIVHDRTAAAEPLVLRGTLGLDEPWRGAPDDPDAPTPAADERVPLRLTTTLTATPLGEYDARITLDPYAQAPTASLHFAARGIDTTALARLLPSFADRVTGDAQGLSIDATLEARLEPRRRDGGLDLAAPFGGEVLLEDVRIADATTGTTWLSLTSLDVVARAIDPRSGAVLLRQVDVDEPWLRVVQRSDGLHVCGLVLRAPPDPAAPVVTTPAGSAPAPRPAPAPTTDAEFALDHVAVHGLAIDYRDETTSPPTVLPLADSDISLHRFSTRAFAEPRTMTFELVLRGGDVELAERKRRSLLGGLVAEATSALGGATATETRALLDQWHTEGDLQLFPSPRGRIRSRIDALELAAFRGLASQSGVELTDGLFDMRLDVELLGRDGLKIMSEHVFTWLAVSEPAGGPIASFLKLPAPLDSVLFLLRNDADEQRIPLHVRVPADGVTRGRIRELVTETLVRVISGAVTGAGTRAAGALAGALFGGPAAVPDVTGSATFAAGDPLPEALDLDTIAAALARDETLAVVLQHEYGQGDLARSRELANPDAAVVEHAIRRLHDRRAALERERAPLAADVAARYAAGQAQEARWRQADLLALETRIGELDLTLAEALRLGADSTSPRAAGRRTRAAAVGLAERRLAALRAELERRVPGLTAARVTLRPGRGVPTGELTSGGRAVAQLRRRVTTEDFGDPFVVVDRPGDPFPTMEPARLPAFDGFDHDPIDPLERLSPRPRPRR
jgi:hypothetical protein